VIDNPQFLGGRKKKKGEPPNNNHQAGVAETLPIAIGGFWEFFP